jgi:hypothetical protein
MSSHSKRKKDAGLDLDQNTPNNDEVDLPIDNIVEVEIDQNQGGDDLLQSASRLVNSIPKRDRMLKRESDARYRANKKTRIGSASDEDFSTIVITLLTLALSAWQPPADIKPNEDELQAFSVPVTRMLLRHIPIAKKMSADMVDIVGMIGAISAYYVRTGEAWKKYNEARAIKATQDHPTENAAPWLQADDPLQYRGSQLVPDGV